MGTYDVTYLVICFCCSVVSPILFLRDLISLYFDALTPLLVSQWGIIGPGFTKLQDKIYGFDFVVLKGPGTAFLLEIVSKSVEVVRL